MEQKPPGEGFHTYTRLVDLGVVSYFKHKLT